MEEKLYPPDWVYKNGIPAKETKKRSNKGRNIEAARKYIQDAVPAGGTPLTTQQLIFLICGRPLDRNTTRQIVLKRRQIKDWGQQIKATTDEEEIRDLKALITNEKEAISALTPPNFADDPAECIQRVLDGLPVASPPDVISITPKEVKQLIYEEIKLRTPEIDKAAIEAELNALDEE